MKKKIVYFVDSITGTSERESENFIYTLAWSTSSNKAAAYMKGMAANIPEANRHISRIQVRIERTKPDQLPPDLELVEIGINRYIPRKEIPAYEELDESLSQEYMKCINVIDSVIDELKQSDEDPSYVKTLKKTKRILNAFYSSRMEMGYITTKDAEEINNALELIKEL